MSKDKIRALNDAFRKSIVSSTPLGKCYMTSGLVAHGEPFGKRVLASIADAGDDVFTEDNDPYGEHDMITVIVDGIKVWGKIDYYSKTDPNLGSEDPANTVLTERVMTIMLPEEY